jgi:O-acetyl-ADP-ribose deacetylase (regulator of RNase III)
MKLLLSALQSNLARAWTGISQDLDFVSVHEGSILDLDCDAVVSPANSFGFMNGGIDLLYSRVFGWHVQERLQEAIRRRHHGELLVGAADIVATGHERIPYMIAAPTMRMPMDIKGTVNPYLAARAVFLLWKHGRFPDGPHAGQPIAEVIQTLALPGLGTGVGSVEPDVCARQVRGAIEDVLLERFQSPESWGQVLQRHEEFLGRPFGSAG